MSKPLQLTRKTSSPQLLTPSSTPPPSAQINLNNIHHYQDQKLSQLLANFDSGTHSFCREDREDASERRMSFSDHALPTPPSSRRSSFLQNLSFRPTFGFSAPSTPISTSHPKESPLSNANTTIPQPKRPEPIPTQTLYTQTLYTHAQSTTVIPLPQPLGSGSMEMKRAATTIGAVKVAGFQVGRLDEERRHFDPSREPKLLGLL